MPPHVHIRGFLWGGVNLLYPPACLLCRRRIRLASEVLCEACEGSLPRLSPPVCQRCGVGVPGAYDAQVCCQPCQRRAVAFTKARAPFLYVGRGREAVLAFKYQGRHRLGAWLASEMTRVVQRDLPVSQIDLIVPVPRHWLKRRLRGAQPTEDLANALARSLKRPCLPGILRQTRWTSTQTRLKPAQRVRNVRGAFQADGRSLAGRTVLLIDDVLTSGATAHACAMALREAGANTIFVLTAARAPSAA